MHNSEIEQKDIFYVENPTQRIIYTYNKIWECVHFKKFNLPHSQIELIN